MILTSFFSASICLLIGMYVYFKGQEKPLNRFFFFFNFLVFVWTSGDFVIPFLLNSAQGTFYDRFSQIGGILITPVFLIFTNLIIGLDLKNIFSKKIVKASLVLAGLLLILVPTPFLIERVELRPYKEIPGSLLSVEILLFLVSFIYGLFLLIRGRLRDRSPKTKKLVFFSAAILMALLCALIWFITISFNAGSTTTVIYIFEVSYALITAYAILRHHLMDIDVIIRKTVLYALLSSTIIAIYVASVFIFEKILQTLTGYTSLITRVLAAFVITLTFQPIRVRIEALLDKIFLRNKFDYQKALAQFTRSLVSILDLRELVDLIVSISEILKTKSLALLLLNEELGQFKVRSSFGLSPTAKTVELDSLSDLVKLLNVLKKVVTREDAGHFISTGTYPILKEELDSLKAAVVIPIFIKDRLNGILTLGEKISDEDYNQEDFNLLTTLADEAGIAIENAKLYGDLRKNYLEIVQALSQAIEASDEYTRGHSDRVTKLAIQIARQLKMNRADIDILKFACILHDIGKIGIIKDILHKPDKLNEAEFNIIKTHPAVGEQIIAPVEFLAPIRPIVRHHHERFDGRGYPDGIKGEEIPYLSRIIAVADTYDAMTSERPYRPALSTEIALAEIKKCSGTQFDPEIVKAFLELDHSMQP